MVIDDEDNIENIENTPLKQKSEIEVKQASINKDKVNLIKNQIKSSGSKLTPKPTISPNKNRPIPVKKDKPDFLAKKQQRDASSSSDESYSESSEDR
jgi:hypothetical protein